MNENQFGEADYKDSCILGLSSMKIEVCINFASREEQKEDMSIYLIFKKSSLLFLFLKTT